jgi:hypothetical protein
LATFFFLAEATFANWSSIGSAFWGTSSSHVLFFWASACQYPNRGTHFCKIKKFKIHIFITLYTYSSILFTIKATK